MQPPPQAGAVVVGAGLAGIAAAAALREAGRGEIVVLERDPPPGGEGEGERRGVPQAGHLHNLLSCAQRNLERLLPGFGDALRAAGAGDAEVATETEVFELGERMPSRRLGLRLMCAKRATLERVARERLLAAGGVRLLHGARVRALALDAGGALAGVNYEAAGEFRTLRAPLVVDASGGRGAGMRWLRAAGAATPPVETVPARRWYVTAEYRRPAAAAGDGRFWMVFPTPPETRAGLLSPSEPGRWQLSLSAGLAEPPPLTDAAVAEFARALPAPWIAQLLAAATPLSEPRLFRRPRAIWRRFDRLRQPLPGFLPLGDSIATLDPLFGQGISVASWQAAELADLLSAPGEPLPLAALTSAYLERAAAAVEAAWSLHRLAAAEPAVAARLREDPELHRRYVGVWHLVEPIATLEPVLAAGTGSVAG